MYKIFKIYLLRYSPLAKGEGDWILIAKLSKNINPPAPFSKGDLLCFDYIKYTLILYRTHVNKFFL